MLFEIGEDFDFSRSITAFQYDVERILLDPTKFAMDVGLRLAARKRFNIKLDHDTTGDGFLMLDEGETLSRLGLPLEDYCNTIPLKNIIHYVSYTPSFQVYMKQGLKNCLISQGSDLFEFRQYDVFIEEAIGQEYFVKVMAEIDVDDKRQRPCRCLHLKGRRKVALVGCSWGTKLPPGLHVQRIYSQVFPPR
jgi:hypothetical protein